MGHRSSRFVSLLVIVLIVLSSWGGRARAGEPKITLEELVAKHLDAIAPANVRAAMKTRAEEFTAKFVVKMGGAGIGEGKGVFITEGRKVAFGLRFPVNDYPGERFIFDGDKVDTAKRTTELRSAQADMVLDNNEILREGLFGGVLSTAWPLGDVTARQAKLKYDGIKSVDGVKLHRVTYIPKKSNNGMTIFLFFDPQTFRHVKTVYSLEVQPGHQGVGYTRNSDVRYSPNNRWKLEEDFGDFKEFYGFTLPTKWKVRYTWEPASRGGDTVIDWELAMTSVVSNGPVDAKSFVIENIAHPGAQ